MTAIVEIHLAPVRGKQGKLYCPVCGSGNWQGMKWWEEHRKKRHVQCDDCDRWFVEGASMSAHRRAAHR